MVDHSDAGFLSPSVNILRSNFIPLQKGWFRLRQLRRGHARENDRYLARQPFRVRRAFVMTRIGRHRGQPRRLLGVQLAGADAEVMACGRLAAENAIAPLDDVEVELEDAPLVE